LNAVGGARADATMKPRVKIAVLLVLAVVALGVLLALLVPRQTGGGSSSAYPPYTDLPQGCVKPPGGYLIIANENGFNDSIQHGAPTVSWPVITVKQGTTVTITVCNSDVQAHGFQVTHYFDSNIETVSPGEVVHVSFVADKVGDFEIYCSIFCTIHVFMQNGLLAVTP
jgi:heme/copper-type cytochrome/quinol oxidase subunit 2